MVYSLISTRDTLPNKQEDHIGRLSICFLWVAQSCPAVSTYPTSKRFAPKSQQNDSPRHSAAVQQLSCAGISPWCSTAPWTCTSLFSTISQISSLRCPKKRKSWKKKRYNKTQITESSETVSVSRETAESDLCTHIYVSWFQLG